MCYCSCPVGTVGVGDVHLYHVPAEVGTSGRKSCTQCNDYRVKNILLHAFTMRWYIVSTLFHNSAMSYRGATC